MDTKELAGYLKLPQPLKNHKISGFAIDSRMVAPKNVFFALKGQKTSGEHFLPQAAARGALAAFVDRQYSGPDFGMHLFQVDDIKWALQELARQRLKALQARVIGITGSLGKTTTKEFLYHILQPFFPIDCNPRSYNSQLTLPLSVLHAQESSEFLILEMGMTQQGEISRLVSVAPPYIALITHIGLSHVCYFPNGQEGIAQAKAEIFSHRNTRYGIYNADTPYAEILRSQGSCEKISFSLQKKEADFYLQQEAGELRIYEKGVLAGCMTTQLPGQHLFTNLLAAIATGRILGLPFEKIKEQAASLSTPALRMQQVECRGVTFINDAYNASSPEAVIGALNAMPQPCKKGRRIAVLGSMLELGAYSEGAHLEVAKKACQTVDMVYCLGQECQVVQKYLQDMKKDVEMFLCRQDLVNRLAMDLRAHDVVLLKGSRSWGMDRIIEEWSHT